MGCTSEIPVHSRPRRLVDWINPTGARKVHSLIDKVYQRKNLEMAWEMVKANRCGKYRSRRRASEVSFARWESRRFTTGCASKHCSIGWNRSSSRYSMKPTSDIEGECCQERNREGLGTQIPVLPTRSQEADRNRAREPGETQNESTGDVAQQPEPQQ